MGRGYLALYQPPDDCCWFLTWQLHSVGVVGSHKQSNNLAQVPISARKRDGGEPNEGADRPFVHLSLAFNPRTAVAANRFGVS